MFGPERRALLAAQLPATTADHASQQARQVAHLTTQLNRIEVAERGLISELEAPADPGNPATAAYRARIRARYAELHNERTTTETELSTLQATAIPDNDPTLLDELPFAADVLPHAPGRIKQALFAAFDIHALYSKDTDQVTIWATLTSDTPRTIDALINDPRTDDGTGQPATPSNSQTPAQAPISQLRQATPVALIFRGSHILHDLFRSRRTTVRWRTTHLRKEHCAQQTGLVVMPQLEQRGPSSILPVHLRHRRTCCPAGW